ncbi:MAG TPA: PAS domain-containing protein [Gemmatimonas sp.]|uniref:PAS domain-containing protein n=1 Tax=Gemmatimonas sp. TaxID=1962908 RepID=UPI002ED793F2
MPLDTTTRMLAPFLNRLNDEELDSIPYGVIQLDPEGFVVSYNRAEAENAGHALRPIGQHFFREVAPSANAPEFHGRFQRGVATGRLDETFTFTYHCDLMPRRVQVRLYLSPQTRSVWLFVAKPDGTPLDWPTADLSPVLCSKHVQSFTGFAALHATVDALLA